MSPKDDGALAGDAAPEILEGRIWVDGCWDFFHHGKSRRGLGRSCFPMAGFV